MSGDRTNPLEEMKEALQWMDLTSPGEEETQAMSEDRCNSQSGNDISCLEFFHKGQKENIQLYLNCGIRMNKLLSFNRTTLVPVCISN